MVIAIALMLALVEPDPSAHDPNVHEWDWVVLPIVSFNADEGAGLGAVGALYHYHGGIQPYRDDVSMRLFVTARLVQRHELRWDGAQFLGMPLRVWARIGFFSTVTQNFCGFGNEVTCDPAVAESEAITNGLVPGTEPYEDFTRHFYYVRFVRPHGDTLQRWRLRDKPHRFEIMTGWRLAWYLPGDFTTNTVYPKSLYAETFPHGEPGISSVAQLGFDVDNRDFEPSPTRGYFFEASLRASSPWWGSAWTYGGTNVSLSTYFPFGTSHNLVMANRGMVDLLHGDVPTEEIAQTGGTRDHAAFGGQWIGRGIRDHRYIGKIKVIDQLELRGDLGTLQGFGTRVDVGGALFGDAAWIGYEFGDFRGDPARILFGGGVGLRLLFNKAILMRIDVAASPFDQARPAFYTPVGYPF